MKAGLQLPREVCVSGDHEGEAAASAELSHFSGESCPARCFVVAEDDAAEAAWEVANGGQRVGQARAVSEQPEDGQLGARPVLYGAGP